MNYLNALLLSLLFFFESTAVAMSDCAQICDKKNNEQQCLNDCGKKLDTCKKGCSSDESNKTMHESCIDSCVKTEKAH